MIAFEVSMDGHPICTAGVPGHGVVSVMANRVKRRQDARRGEAPMPSEELELEVGGLDSDAGEQLKWFYGPLSLGSSLLVRVVERAQVDAPAKTYPRETEEDARCSFCNARTANVKRMIVGRGGRNYCVANCVDELK
ncbi:MAG: hypothetical protein ABI968_02275 [Acidobacteriota bacterium]